MVDIKELLKAGVHFGHRTSRWSPNMKPYIWGAKNKIHLLDVAKTAFLLDRACKFLTEIAAKGGHVLWVGTKRAARTPIEETGKKLDQPFVIHRWIGGTLSNFSQVKKAMTRLLHLRDILEKSQVGTGYYTKKELSTLTKELQRLEKNVGGILNLSYPPAAVVVVDALKERAAVHEALRLGIPVVAMVDTNTDPTNINFVIPSNDDAPRAIQCVLTHLVGAIETGTKEHVAKKEAQQAAKAAEKKATEKVAQKSAATTTKEAPAKEKAAPAEEKKPAAKAAPKPAAPTAKADAQKPAAKPAEKKPAAKKPVAKKEPKE